MTPPSADQACCVKVEFIGQEGEPVVVVDHCAPDPAALVNAAMARDYAPLGEFYPGVRTHASKAYFESLGPLLAKVAREVFGYREQLALLRSLYSLVTTPPADLSLAQRIPHFDSVDDGMIAVLHYLTPRDLGGTSFYRHRSTGFETVGASRHQHYLQTLRADFERHGTPPAGYIAGDTAIFERIASFPAAYNRALIYRSSLLHCAAVDSHQPLSPDPSVGRLTIASFLAAR
uniref:Uncharacterized protein n=1 Tax=Caulobacter sp. (strain K31) TaxID=366602 RepID=B0T6X9_CAUSK